MTPSDLKRSISQMENDLTTSSRKLQDKLETLKADLKALEKCLLEKNKQIAELKEQKKDLLSSLEKVITIIDDPSQDQLLEDFCNVESEVKTLLSMAQTEDQYAAERLAANGITLGKPFLAEGSSAEPGADAKKWAEDLMKNIGKRSEPSGQAFQNPA